MKKKLLILFLVCSIKGYSQKDTDLLCVCHFWGKGSGMVLLEPFWITKETSEKYKYNFEDDVINKFDKEIGFDKIELGFKPSYAFGMAFSSRGCSIFHSSLKSEANEVFNKKLKYAKYLVKWQPPFDLTGIPVTQKSPVITKVEKEEVKVTTSKEKVNQDYITKSTYHEDAKKAEERAQLRMLQAEAELEVKKMAARAQGMLNDLKLEQMLAKLRNQPKMKTNRQ